MGMEMARPIGEGCSSYICYGLHVHMIPTSCPLQLGIEIGTIGKVLLLIRTKLR